MTRAFAVVRRAESQAETPRTFDSMEERDKYLEAQYAFVDRRGYCTTLSFVAAEVDELVREFHQTWEGVEDMAQALIRFEVSRFGCALEPMAHGILSFGIRRSMRTGLPPERTAKVPARLEGEGSLDYVARIARANGWAPPGAQIGRPMPGSGSASSRS